MTTPRPATELSADEARRIALRAQGFLGTPDRKAGVRGVLRHLGAVQLDTISVLARSHELIPYARLGAVGRKNVEDAYWQDTHAFEYWSHAACILPIEEWPHFAFRRRAYRNRPHWNHALPEARTTRSSNSSAPKARSPPPTWAERRRPASGGTGPAPRSPWNAP